MENKKSYYSIIPANIRYDEELKPNEKLLYGEITALTNEKGYCWANNNYFAELYGVNTETVSRWISSLNKRGYITIEINQSEGNERKIYINAIPIDKKDNTYCQKDQDLLIKNAIPIDEKRKHNNTSNNTLNTKLNNYSDNPDLISAIKDFIDMRKVNKKIMTDKAIDLMLQKLNELAGDDQTKIAILNQSIENCWQGVFPLKEGQYGGANKNNTGGTGTGHRKITIPTRPVQEITADDLKGLI